MARSARDCKPGVWPRSLARSCRPFLIARLSFLIWPRLFVCSGFRAASRRASLRRLKSGALVAQGLLDRFQPLGDLVALGQDFLLLDRGDLAGDLHRQPLVGREVDDVRPQPGLRHPAVVLGLDAVAEHVAFLDLAAQLEQVASGRLQLAAPLQRDRFGTDLVFLLAGPLDAILQVGPVDAVVVDQHDVQRDAVVGQDILHPLSGDRLDRLEEGGRLVDLDIEPLRREVGADTVFAFHPQGEFALGGEGQLEPGAEPIGRQLQGVGLFAGVLVVLAGGLRSPLQGAGYHRLGEAEIKAGPAVLQFRQVDQPVNGRHLDVGAGVGRRRDGDGRAAVLKGDRIDRLDLERLAADAVGLDEVLEIAGHVQTDRKGVRTVDGHAQAILLAVRIGHDQGALGAAGPRSGCAARP